jgi:hypothetical protein
MFDKRLPPDKRAPKGAAWPRAKIEEGLKRGFRSLILIGEDDAHTIYDVEDRAYRFVVALVHEAGAKAGVTELGFLARFVGFKLSENVLRKLNGELHLSAAYIEDGDLYMLAKVAAKGPFVDSKFALMLSAWKRDMSFALDALGRAPSASAAVASEFGFDGAQIKARPTAFHGAFFWRNEPMTPCAACGGGGRAGLMKRQCAACDGAGFVDLAS